MELGRDSGLLRNKIIEAELAQPETQEETRFVQGRIQAFTDVLRKLGAPAAPEEGSWPTLSQKEAYDRRYAAWMAEHLASDPIKGVGSVR